MGDLPEDWIISIVQDVQEIIRMRNRAQALRQRAFMFMRLAEKERKRAQRILKLSRTISFITRNRNFRTLPRACTFREEEVLRFDEVQFGETEAGDEAAAARGEVNISGEAAIDLPSSPALPSMITD